ncbi:MAG TPA: hypothetical protein VM914_07970 [Pyrinomonadaceae bacterium]|jgi:hypothetical protein|nr:hypothetical protein [Pyrinomonadaceae bacterium]
MRLENLLRNLPTDDAASRQQTVYKVMEGCEHHPKNEHVHPMPFRPTDGGPSVILALKRGLDTGNFFKSRLNSLLDGRSESPERGADSGGAGVLGPVRGDASGVVKAGHFDFIPNPIDAVGGVLEAGADLLNGGIGAAFLKYAAEHGLRLVGRVREEVHKLLLDAINKSLGMGDKIEALGVGDSYTLGGGVDAGWGADGSVEGAVEVTRTGDNCYVVSAEASAQIGLKLFEGSAAGAGGRVEFKFDNPEDAKRAALILAAGAAGVGAVASAASGNPAAALLAPALAPTGGDIKFLQSHLSSAEITRDMSAELDGKVEVGAFGNGAAFEGEISHGYRMEFENGKPVAIVRTSEVSVSADAARNLILSQVGEQAGSELTEAIGRGGAVTATLTVETRMALDGAKISDVASFLADPNPSAFVGVAETSIKASVEVDLGGHGVEAEVELSRMSIADAQRVAGDLLRGDVMGVLKNLPPGVSVSMSRFEDTGRNPHIDLKVQGFGIEIEGRSEERDRTPVCIGDCDEKRGPGAF